MSFTPAKTESTDKVLKAALAYARKGWPVFPITSDDKDPPLVKWRFGSDTGANLRKRKATTDVRTIRAWWKRWPGANIGVVCGPDSGFWALDIDGEVGEASLAALVKRHGKLPKTREHKTPRSGRHYLFKCSEHTTAIENKVKFTAGLDTRADGGYIVMPPSHTEPGANTVKGDYRRIRQRPIAEAPQWLIDEITKGATEPATSATHDADYKPAFVLPDVINEGSRDVTVFKYLCQLRGYGATGAELRDAAARANERCKPPLAAKVLEVKVDSACRHKAGGRDELKLAELTGKPLADTPDYVDMNQNHRSLKEILEDDDLVQKWIIQELFEEGAVLVIAGSPKTGKTIFTLHNILHMKGVVSPLAAEYKATKGTEKFPIGYFNEMGEKQLKRKIQEVKPGITDATIAKILGSIEIWDKMPVLDAVGLKQFEAQIVKHRFRVFVIDTVARVRPAMRGTDVASADAKFVNSIAEIARRTNCCIVLLTQNNKRSGATESLTDRIGHTNQFLAAADDYVSIYRKYDDDQKLNRRRYMVAAGRNIKETDVMILTLNGDGLRIDGSLFDVETTEAQKSILECVRRAPAPMTPKQIATELGKKRTTVRNTVERMITKETLMRFGRKGCVTTPPHALALRAKARREAL